MILSKLPLTCPLDGQLLSVTDKTLMCPDGHSFDISAQGHVNLLPVQFKRSKDPGDSKLMVAARRSVMDLGLFDPVAQVVTGLVCDHASDTGLFLVDAGCGEGYYTGHMHQGLKSKMTDPRILGIDISKWAVLSAAKRYKKIGWAVASNKRLPIVQSSPDIITSIFGFETWGAWAALQQVRQIVIVVDAGRDHLLELREIIYPDVRASNPPTTDKAIANGYEKISNNKCRYTKEIISADVLGQILKMTPHGHKISKETRARVQSISNFSLTFEVEINVYSRTETSVDVLDASDV
jgi:23S rRNA (guanine745-N1)-methyltransferase